MLITQIFKEHSQPIFSFEFFPPKSPAAAVDLQQTIQALAPLRPAYVSVTYGAGGSTRDLTHDLLIQLQKSLTVVSHLTCVGSTQEELKGILSRYSDSGIINILALRGDPPQGQSRFVPTPGGFLQAAQLVTFIKEQFPQMAVGVAAFPEGHPETPNRLREMDYLKAKVDAGADYICTQLFFDNHAFWDFQERCAIAGINVPIIAGIMPITSWSGLQRMAELAAGANIPAKLMKALQRARHETYIENVGIHWATEQVRDLLDHDVRGVHFYTLNKSKATRQIYANLGLHSF